MPCATETRQVPGPSWGSALLEEDSREALPEEELTPRYPALGALRQTDDHVDPLCTLEHRSPNSKCETLSPLKSPDLPDAIAGSAKLFPAHPMDRNLQINTY